MTTKPYHVEVEELQPQPVAVVRGHVETAEIPGFLAGAFGESMQVLAAQHLTPAGPPFARWRPADGAFEAEAGFPSSGEVTPEGRVEADSLPGGPAATVMHHGDYGAVGAAYEAVTEWLGANGYVAAGEPWESYLDGPEVAEPRTVVRFPCQLA